MLTFRFELFTFIWQVEVIMSGHMRAQFILITTIAFGLAGCNIIGNESDGSPVPVSSTFEFRVSGGFAGSVEQTVVDSTGLARLTYYSTPTSPAQTFTHKLSFSELDSLRNAFGSSNFFLLDDRYEATQRIVDGFNLQVAWDTGTRSKKVWVEANATTPPRLAALIGFMFDLADKIRSAGQRS